MEELTTNYVVRKVFPQRKIFKKDGKLYEITIKEVIFAEELLELNTKDLKIDIERYYGERY